MDNADARTCAVRSALRRLRSRRLDDAARSGGARSARCVRGRGSGRQSALARALAPDRDPVHRPRGRTRRRLGRGAAAEPRHPRCTRCAAGARTTGCGCLGARARALAAEDFPGLPRKLATLFSFCVIDTLGFGILIPLVPYMADRFGTAPQLITPVLGSYSLCQLLAAPWWGRLSDRYGRRPILMTSLAGACASYALLGFAVNIWWLLASRMLAGAMAGNIAAAFAYAADVSAGEACRLTRAGRCRHRHRLHAGSATWRTARWRRSAHGKFQPARGGVGRDQPACHSARQVRAAG